MALCKPHCYTKRNWRDKTNTDQNDTFQTVIHLCTLKTSVGIYIYKYDNNDYFITAKLRSVLVGCPIKRFNLFRSGKVSSNKENAYLVCYVLSICHFVRPSVRHSVRHFVRHSVCPSVILSVILSVRPSFCRSLCRSFYWPTCHEVGCSPRVIEQWFHVEMSGTCMYVYPTSASCCTLST